MSNIRFALGIVCMILGVALVFTAVVRSLNHRWDWGIHELWLLPITGVVLMLAGRWLIQ